MTPAILKIQIIPIGRSTTFAADILASNQSEPDAAACSLTFRKCRPCGAEFRKEAPA
jgi:hypothetical protein